MQLRRTFILFVLLSGALGAAAASTAPAGAAEPEMPATPIGVGPQYNTSHVYVAPEDLDRFVASFVATFGGSSTPQAALDVTPTPSQTAWEAAATPVGLISAFGFTTPIPYPFGAERTGYLVTDVDAAAAAARAAGAAVVVEPFDDPVGRDVIVEWPGGIYMQFYRHKIASDSPPLASVPENRVYLSRDNADEFIRDFSAFSRGKIVADDASAPGSEIGEPAGTYRRVRIESVFGKMTVLVTDGHLPYPYGRETTGYAVKNLADALKKAEAADAKVLILPYASADRTAAIVQFPGGYIAEIHSLTSR